MSAGLFIASRYEASYGDGLQIHPIRVQPETEAAAIGATTNAPPAGTPTSPISAQVSGSRRRLGLFARMVRLEIDGAPPATYAAFSRVAIPALNEAFYNAASVRGTEVAYLGTTWLTAGVTAERAA